MEGSGIPSPESGAPCSCAPSGFGARGEGGRSPEAAGSSSASMVAASHTTGRLAWPRRPGRWPPPSPKRASVALADEEGDAASGEKAALHSSALHRAFARCVAALSIARILGGAVGGPTDHRLPHPAEASTGGHRARGASLRKLIAGVPHGRPQVQAFGKAPAQGRPGLGVEQ